MSKSWGKSYFINKNTVNVLDDQEFSWLHRACALDDYPTVVELVEQAGANINIQGSFGDTPLHYTVYYGNLKITKYLLEAGGDIYIRNEAGNTVIDEAKKSKDSQISNLLSFHETNLRLKGAMQTGYDQSDDYSLDSSSHSHSDQSTHLSVEVASSGEGSYYSDSE